MPYILASASPRRQELLHKITDDFIIQPADVDETIPDDILPEDAAVYLSHIKAEAVSNQYPGSIVIGCDTIVLLNDQILESLIRRSRLGKCCKCSLVTAIR